MITIAVAEPDTATGQLNALLQGLLRHKNVVHAVIGIESGDRSFRWVGAAGTAYTDGTPMREDIPYFIASVTKLYIAAAVLKLHERGLVDLDNSISTVLPQEFIGGLHRWKGVDYTDNITIRNLLSHTSGLPDWLEDRPKGGKSMLEQIDKEEDRFIPVEDAIDFVRRELVPHFPPQPAGGKRIRIRYSDTNFQLLIAMIEELTGRPLHQAFEDLVFTPLDLRHTFHPGHPPAEPLPEPAVLRVDDKPLRKPLLMQSFRDLYSTVDDQLDFMRGLIQGDLFMNSDSTGLMQQQWHPFRLPRDTVELRQPSWPIAYGLGMMHFRMPRLFTPFKPIPAVVGHTGVTGSWLFYCPERDLYLCGTVDQTSAAPLPFRFVPKLLRALDNLRD